MNQPPSEPLNPAGATGLRLAPFWKRSMDDAASAGAAEPFDALADLFLGEIATKPAAAARKSAPVTATEEGPRLRLAGSADESEYSLAPATARAASQEKIETRPASPVLALAGEEEGEARSVAVLMPPPVRNPVMECVVLANLPVIGAAWASQYVREVAAAAGKLVACLRVEGEFIRLELIGLPPEGVTLPTLEEVGSLEGAIDAAAEITDRWIVRCDAGEEKVVAACGITRAMTILSGADPMAREACRPVFERLAGMLPAESANAPMVRLALMGAGTAEAKAIGEGLARIAEQTLGRAVTPVVCSAKIGAARPGHMLFSGSAEMGLKGILSSVERALVPDAVGGVFPAGASAGTCGAAAPSRIEQVEDDLRGAAVETLKVERLADEQPAVSIGFAVMPLPGMEPSVAEVAAGRVEVQEPVLVPEPERKRETVVRSPVTPEKTVGNTTGGRAASATRFSTPTPTPALSPAAASLASHLAELKPLGLRCPYAEGIELAVDAAGTLHLLARSESEVADEGALAALMVASSWAEAHASILAAARAEIEPGKRPMLHLFTDRAKRSRRLLDTALRVHLLAPVSVGGQSGWYCTELN